MHVAHAINTDGAVPPPPPPLLYASKAHVRRSKFSHLLSISANFSLQHSEVRCEVRKFVAKFKSSFRNSQTGLWIKNLIGFIELKGQSQSLFTNWLANSEMNFWTSQWTCEIPNELVECCIEKLAEIDNNAIVHLKAVKLASKRPDCILLKYFHEIPSVISGRITYCEMLKYTHESNREYHNVLFINLFIIVVKIY